MTSSPQTDTQELLRLAIGPACHELRSPLAVVYGFARMLESAELDDASKRYVAQIVRGAERLDLMLDDLAQLGRTAAERVAPHLEKVMLREVVDELKELDVNHERLYVDDGANLSVRADRDWLKDSLQAVIDGLCFEEGIDIRLSWREQKDNVQIQIVPSSTFPMIDVEPEKSSLGISLARMRIVAMKGDFSGVGDRVLIDLPRA